MTDPKLILLSMTGYMLLFVCLKRIYICTYMLVYGE